MKKIIIDTTDATGKPVRQITCLDERWYQKDDLFVPSSTWICSYYPKGIAYMKWLAEHGWNEAESLKNEAADKGSKVHHAIEDLLDGKEVKMDDKYLNNSTEEMEELTLEEYEALMSFKEWFDETKPKVLMKEVVVFNKQYGYAGTVDLVCKIGKDTYIIDFKTSQYIWPSHELQISSYKHASKRKDLKLAILQLGYRRNKNKFKFTEVEDKFDLFLSARTIWANENKDVSPRKIDYPVSLILNQESKTPKKNVKKTHHKKAVQGHNHDQQGGKR